MRALRQSFSILLLAAGSAAAQVPAPASIREQLLQSADTTELRRIELEHARTAQSSAAALTAGFAALRLADITGDTDHAYRARRYFDRLADRDPQNAWAHYGYALSFRLDIEHVPGPHEFVIGGNAFAVLGLDARARARRALERAVALDPALPGAITLLAQYAAETRDRESLEQVRNVLSARRTNGNASPEDVVTLAATLRRMRAYDDAINILRPVMAQLANAPAATLYELARSLVHRPGSQHEAGTTYLRALASGDDALVTQLWQDVILVAREAERNTWRDANLEQRRALLQRFWDVRAALTGVTAAERIAEHYRRLDHARDYYSRIGKYGAPSTNSLVLARIDDNFDDRGVIYIRHGQPLDIVRSTGSYRSVHPAPVPWEAWAYLDDVGATVLYHFAKFPPTYSEGGSTDFVLVNNVDCGVVDDQHLKYDQRLKRLAFRCDALERRSVGASIRSDAREALRTESFRPPLTVALPFHYDYVAFRGSGGNTLLVGSVGVPLARLGQDRALRVALTVADTATGQFNRTELVTPTVGPALDSSQLRTHLSIEVAPGNAVVHRISIFDFDDASVGMLYGGPLRVPDFRADTLMLSDVVIAHAAPHGDFTRGSYSFSLAPAQSFERGEFRVFYEIYNIAPGTRYQTEMSVEAIDAGLRATIRRLFGGKPPVILSFGGVAPLELTDRVIQEVREVRADLPAGKYRLKISVTPGDTRRRLLRERTFTVQR